MGSLLAAALTRAQSFLLEPADRRPSLRIAGDGPRDPIEVSVLGTCAGCGVSTLASGLELMLAAPDRPASLVRDVTWSADQHEEAGRPGDAVVLVTPGNADPTIAELIASLMRERNPSLLFVANKVGDEDSWRDRADLCVPDSWFCAALVARGRRPPGPFGSALGRLAALIEQGVAV